MNFERLLTDKKIEKIEKSEFTLDSVEKSIQFAKKGMETQNYDEVMSVIYNGIFKISNKIMNFLGYRPIGKENHKNLFEFLSKIEIDQELVKYFDNIRKKRNNFIYRDVSSISKTEAEEIINKAEEFVHKIRTFVHKIRTQK